MKIGPKYKIARRLGAPIFDKTQSPKFAISEARRGKPKDSKHARQKTDFGAQLIEKQKARFTYGVNERQFAKYVREAGERKGAKPTEELYRRLESRLDNAVYRLGFVNSRSFARQMVSHGHIQVNGRRTNIPSYELHVGDKISIHPGSAKKPLFATLDEKLKTITPPSWMKFNSEKKEAEVQGAPKTANDIQFSLGAIFEFYSR